MAILRPFRAVHPTADSAARVAAVPYDVVDVDEARALADGNPLSFLHVSRAEIDLPPGTDPHADEVYHLAAARYQQLKHHAPLVQEMAPALYLYRLTLSGHSQTGLAGCFSLDDYDRDVIKKHERTRRDKEDDRTRHIVELRAQTGPVFLIHKPIAAFDEVVARQTAATPLLDVDAVDGVRHTIWRVDAADARWFVQAFAAIDALYIADGHHRAASAARARQAGGAEANLFLAVAFPSDQVRILPYHRVVRDLHGRTGDGFLGELARAGIIARKSPAQPDHKGQVAMYVGGTWYGFEMDEAGLDCDLLQTRVLASVLGIGDVRSDARISFIGGARGTKALEQLVDGGKAAVAFSMYPVSVQELMAVSDAGRIMPPKSTWFEPKLRDGLLIHEIT